jgi:hypothetical protein
LDSFESMGTAELQEEIAALKREKEGLEWQEQRVRSPSNAIAARDRLALEDKIAGVAQRLGKLRLVLRQRGAPYS